MKDLNIIGTKVMDLIHPLNIIFYFKKIFKTNLKYFQIHITLDQFNMKLKFILTLDIRGN